MITVFIIIYLSCHKGFSVHTISHLYVNLYNGGLLMGCMTNADRFVCNASCSISLESMGDDALLAYKN